MSLLRSSVKKQRYWEHAGPGCARPASIVYQRHFAMKPTPLRGQKSPPPSAGLYWASSAAPLPAQRGMLNPAHDTATVKPSAQAHPQGRVLRGESGDICAGGYGLRRGAPWTHIIRPAPTAARMAPSVAACRHEEGAKALSMRESPRRREQAWRRVGFYARAGPMHRAGRSIFLSHGSGCRTCLPRGRHWLGDGQQRAGDL